MEYLFVVVLSLALILPASFLFFDFSKGSEDAVVSSQVNRIGNQIVSSAEEMYVLGKDSRVTLDLVMPDSLKSMNIYGGRELVVSYYTQTGLTQAVFFSDINMTNRTATNCNPGPCSIDVSPGANAVRVESEGDAVSVVRT